MRDTHCYRCGGFMSYRQRVSYRVPSDTRPRVIPHGNVCSCRVPILDGPPPGYASIASMPSAVRPRPGAVAPPPARPGLH